MERSNEAHLLPGEAFHVPVLCKAVLEGIVTDRRGTYVDATVGGGGHAAALLEVLEHDATVLGIDQDPEALAVCTRQFESDDRFQAVHGNFGELAGLLAGLNVTHVDGLLFDLGVSSHQIDTARRGFSYRLEGPLDMRMNPDAATSALDIINEASIEELTSFLRHYGEEPRAGRVAASIEAARPVATTRELADAVRAAVPHRDLVKTLSRVFQAVRIAVNDELRALEEALMEIPAILSPGGRVAVISYHSLEDRRVKRFLRYGNIEGNPVRDIYGNLLTPFELVTRRPIRPEEAEIEANPRARSARLRIAERRTEA